ncbi:MAG: protein-methionine-sulfoxide reductase catalytic subunit MsrP [Methyloligellaceae bacterium]
MLIRSHKGWEIPESRVTPETVALNRRTLLTGAGALTAAKTMGLGAAFAAADPTLDLYPAKENTTYEAGRPVTGMRFNLTYNNFYEFGPHKKIHKAAQNLVTQPWEIQIAGEVEKPFTIAIDDLIRKIPLEERIYRHRCVEAWSMTVPWTGFPARKFVELAKPLSSAKYIRMETFFNPEVATGQRPSLFQATLPWPYVEGMTMAEANNDLALFVTGAYGKPLPKQMGAPFRLHLPWKYGFKSIKSIVKIEFTRDRPKSFWEAILPREYGFWANVNPKVRHPRWSQATERVLGTNSRIPTQLYNGYGAWVSDLYKDLKSERLWM